jgi:hypothetical protein
MRWATLSHVHLDRVASPWLVRRFVDPAADFEFVEWGLDGKLPDSDALVIPEGATPLGIPGARLGLHDANGTCFSKVLRAFDLQQPGLWAMNRIIVAGISNALGSAPPPSMTDTEHALGVALDLLGAAFSLCFDDADHIEAAQPLYDAIYEHCRVGRLPAEVLDTAPFLPPLRVPYLRAALAESPDAA